MEIINFTDDVVLANNARKKASLNYTVGAVAKGISGKKYVGYNTENEEKQISAIENAINKGTSEGERTFEYVFVIAGEKGKESEEYVLQDDEKEFLKKFSNENFKIYNMYGKTVNVIEI